jgi:GNAT superfamily N-acetyltransferase
MASFKNNLRDYRVDETLRDGGSLHIRTIRRDDRQRLLTHFKALSPRSVHSRFFGMIRTLSDEELTRLTDLDFIHHVGLVATLGEGPDEPLIGVGRYIVSTDGQAPGSAAEVAFAVLDEHQGRGIGTLLLKHLARIAWNHGITEFQANVLSDNQQMLEVFADSGFRIRKTTDSGVVHLSFPIASAGRSQPK